MVKQSEFGARVREVRHRRGWTQVQLAERSRLSLHTVRAIEQGWRGHNLRVDTVAQLATALGVRRTELTGEEANDE